jgi:hypothetical protein
MADLSNDKRAREIRRCGKCGANAVRVFYVTTHYVNGGYSGRTYSHRCEQCKAEFESLSLLRLASRGMVAGLFGLGGIAAIVAFVTGLVPLYDDSLQGLALSYGLFGAMSIGGLVYGALLTRRVIALSRNPVATSP